MKGIKASELRKKNAEELQAELKKMREELQGIKFSKVSGTSVSKLTKIKQLRRGIARALTVINTNSKDNVVNNLRKRTRTDKDGKTEVVEVRNLKAKHLPKYLRAKKTRAMRRALTKSQANRVNVRILKRRMNFPLRKFAVPSSN